VVHYVILVILDRACNVIFFLIVFICEGELTMLDKLKEKFWDFMLVVLLLAFIANLIHGAI